MNSRETNCILWLPHLLLEDQELFADADFQNHALRTEMNYGICMVYKRYHSSEATLLKP